jgi:transcription initiation factor TFIIE subunit alpha
MKPELLNELVIRITGKNSEALVGILKDEKSVNEFKIAEKLELTINQTRNILYKLYSQGVVYFTRKKDERKGWYIYFWMLNVTKALERFIALKQKELDELQHQITSHENKRFFRCKNDCVELNEESAMIHNFLCSECGNLLQLANHEKNIHEFRGRISRIKSEIEEAKQERAKIQEEKEKKEEKKQARKKAGKKAKKKGKKKTTKKSKPKLKKKSGKTKKKTQKMSKHFRSFVKRKKGKKR